MEYKVSILKIIHETIVDGIGLRESIYCAGCSHGCKNCHNPKSWDINNGTLIAIQDIYDEIMEHNPILTGITFTGGDPMFQAEAFCKLAKMIKENSQYDIWCYTGFSFEDIIDSRDEKYEFLKSIDILVDGRYIDGLRDTTIAFRGSSNQRIIDVQESLKQNTIVTLSFQGLTIEKIYTKIKI